jgi:hypothetical protein
MAHLGSESQAPELRSAKAVDNLQCAADELRRRCEAASGVCATHVEKASYADDDGDRIDAVIVVVHVDAGRRERMRILRDALDYIADHDDPVVRERLSVRVQ